MLHLKNKSLDEYFDYDLATDAIRVKGHRVGIDLILDAYLSGKSMAELQEEFDSLTEEELHATIAYYLLNKEELDHWLEQVRTEVAQHMAEVDAHPTSATLRLKQLFAEQQAQIHHAN